MKVTQYDCNFENLAPAGCTQYFFGPPSQSVQTFNFAGGQHLANQKQQICVRRERGQCQICWTTAMDTDFVVSGGWTKAKPFTNGSRPKIKKLIVPIIGKTADMKGYTGVSNLHI